MRLFKVHRPRKKWRCALKKPIHKIYYAHHRWKYGTQIEDYELNFLKKRFPGSSIFNPSIDIDDCNRSEKDIMSDCIDEVLKSDVIVFSSMDGMIGKGVYQEVKAAKNAGKVVLYLSQNHLTTDFHICRTYNFSDRLYAYVYAH